jgi:arginine utilization protein RocB
MNVSPWGKDFHKLTERVLKADLFERTPERMLAVVREALGWGQQA